ncbi:MAG: class I SAM-dependent methyltransferase [Patescibacteria group bacterium]
MVKWTQWDKIFKEQGKVFKKPQEDMPGIVKLFKKDKVKKVLDLGCGSGRHVIYLTKKGFDVYGMDNSECGIRIARNWLREEGIKADLKIGCFCHRLPYKSSSFDAIVSVQTMMHAFHEDIKKAIREIKRVLKPNGFIFVTVVKDRHFKKYKIIDSRTRIPLGGAEKGLVHYFYNKRLLKKDFRDFKIFKTWNDSGNYYCLFGKKII